MTVSVVIPVFQEQDNVIPLLEEFVPVAQHLPDLEVLVVDDGSTDATWARLQESASRFPFLRGIRADRNRGQSAAMLLGLQEAKGDILVTLDGDRQNKPADIPRLVEATRQFDVVCGYRAHRRDTWSRRLASRLGNGIRNAVTHDGLRDTGCSLKAFRRACAAGGDAACQRRASLHGGLFPAGRPHHGSKFRWIIAPAPKASPSTPT